MVSDDKETLAGALEDEVRERFGATGDLERSVARKVVERGSVYGVYIELSREVDDVVGVATGASDMQVGTPS